MNGVPQTAQISGENKKGEKISGKKRFIAYVYIKGEGDINVHFIVSLPWLCNDMKASLMHRILGIFVNKSLKL